MNAPFAYVGGKSKLSHQIIEMIPKHKTYAEGFFGAGWVYFRKGESKHEVVNDLDSDLITFYRCVKHHLNEFVNQFKWLLLSREQFLDYRDPVDHNRIGKCLYAALNNVIGEEERKRRNITFHSWRYFLNSALVNAKIPLQKVQSVTGHLTDEMTQHYYALTINDMTDILIEQEKISNFIMGTG